MNTKQFKLTSQKFSEKIFFTIYPIKVIINSRVNRLFSKVFLPENIYLLLYASPHFRAGKKQTKYNTANPITFVTLCYYAKLVPRLFVLNSEQPALLCNVIKQKYCFFCTFNWISVAAGVFFFGQQFYQFSKKDAVVKHLFIQLLSFNIKCI